MNPVNTVRAYAFLAAVFTDQQQDPFCRKCKALVNSIAAVRDSLLQFERDHAAELGSLPPEVRVHFDRARKTLLSLSMPENLLGQKKAGNCTLPEGVCLVKSSLSILKKI